MVVSLPSYAKINIGLAIGALRPDGFHQLETIYQTIALHDTITVEVHRGAGIEIRCASPEVPRDEKNTCWRVAERVLRALKKKARVTITIQKSLPVQGGLGAASSNAVTTMLALERALKARLSPAQRLHIAAQVGSDLPLFLLGGTVLGVGRGEQVYPLPDLPSWPSVVALPDVRVSTPAAFQAWDEARGRKLTLPAPSGTLNTFSQRAFSWLSGSLFGVPACSSGDRAETLLLELVRTGIENDFETVVFPQYPELRAVKRGLERGGAAYASLSGSGAALYGLFPSAARARAAAGRLRSQGIEARVTRTLNRAGYWEKVLL